MNRQSLQLLPCLAAVLLAAPLMPQSTHGVFVGVVKDPSNALVPGAAVAISNAASGAIVFKGLTDAQGAYTAPAVPAGAYHFLFEAQGFKLTEVRNVTLKVDERVQVNARLDPGIVTERVTVSGESIGHLKTESSSINEVIHVAQMRNLPLPGGGRGDDVLNVLMLVAGVSAGGNGARINAQQISINGSRTLNT
ncbi:MAG: carboxypeptidase regulatory-like domain-containing protein, partial [Bryobacteraceae bacterium]